MAKLKILLVEPEKHWELLIKTLLSDRYEVTAIDNIEETLHRMDEERFQLVLLNFQLPDHNGVELLNERASDGELFAVPCIVYGDIAELASVDDRTWVAYGVEQYIKKSELAIELLSAVSKMVKGLSL